MHEQIIIIPIESFIFKSIQAWGLQINSVDVISDQIKDYLQVIILVIFYCMLLNIGLGAVLNFRF